MADNSDVLPWKTRWKIAIGAARGLRFLHEESRVRCVVQRNNFIRPPNEPANSVDSMPAGLGMSCFSSSDHAQTGSMTDKADVYAFGVMLLELITGRKALDTTRARGPMTLMEWAKPLVQAGNTAELVDPRLRNVYDGHQLHRMVDAARRCINLPQLPTMSEVLQILERKLCIQPIPVVQTFASQSRNRSKLSYDTMLC